MSFFDCALKTFLSTPLVALLEDNRIYITAENQLQPSICKILRISASVSSSLLMHSLVSSVNKVGQCM